MLGKRMFSEAVTERDEFCSLSFPAQIVYFKAGLAADDDGFVPSPTRIARSVGADISAVNELYSAGFLYRFPSGISLMPHFLVNNKIRRDRYHPSDFKTEREMIFIDKNMEFHVFDNPPESPDFISLIEYYSHLVTEGKETKGKETKGKETKRKLRKAKNLTLRSAKDEKTTYTESECSPPTAEESAEEYFPGQERYGDGYCEDGEYYGERQYGTDTVGAEKNGTPTPSGEKAEAEKRNDTKTETVQTDGSRDGLPSENITRTKVPYSSKAYKPPLKKAYGKYENVMLSEEDIWTLKNKFPRDYSERIDRLSEYLETSGRKYFNHRVVIESWAKEDEKKKKEKAANSSFDTDEFFEAALRKSYGTDY